MSFGFSVPLGDPAGFEQRLSEARAAAGPSDQVTSATCEAACAAAVALASTLAEQDTDWKWCVGASISGHHPTEGTLPFPSASVSVNFAQRPEEVTSE